MRNSPEAGVLGPWQTLWKGLGEGGTCLSALTWACSMLRASVEPDPERPGWASLGLSGLGWSLPLLCELRHQC